MKVIIDNSFIVRFCYDQYNGLYDMLELLRVMNYEPVIVKNIYDSEILHDRAKNIIDEECVEIIDLTNLYYDENSKRRFRANFIDLYDNLCEKSKLKGKIINEVDFDHEKDIFNIGHKQGSSVGDVYIVLAAHKLNIPIIMTNDNDFFVLESCCRDILNLDNQSIKFMMVKDLILEVKNDRNNSFGVEKLKIIEKKINSHRK